MRRTAFWPVLVMTLSVLSGNGTAAEEEPQTGAIHPPMPVPEMPVPETYRPTGPALRPTLEAAPMVEGPAPLAPALATGFAGLDDPVCSLVECTIPPDTHGAVGPNHLMEVLNTEVQVQNRSGVVLWGPVKLDDFWGPVNGGGGTFDPRVHYDPYADRWITVAVDDDHASSSALLVGASQTPDPTGAWYLQAIDVDGADLAWADYPSVGFNSKWVVVQVNMFNISGSVFNRSHIYVFDKAQLYAGTFNPTLFTLLTLGEPLADQYGGTQVPTATYDVAETDLHLLQRWNGNLSGVGYLRLYTISGPTATPTLLGLNPSPMFVATGPGEAWQGSALGLPDNFAPQIEPPAAIDGCTTCAPGTCQIQTNDDRLQNVVQRNGRLWAAQTIFLPPEVDPVGAPGVPPPTRSSIQWWQIDPATTNVDQRGLVDDPGGSRFFAFPSIAVNKHEDVLLGYSSFESTQYPSGSYSFRSASDPPNTMQSESILKDGEACYYKDFGVGRNRWGDYSATIIDPTDDTKLWTLQEYANLPNTARPFTFWDGWGTWWGMLDPTRTVSIDDVSMAEGDFGTTAFVFTVTLSAPTPLEVRVDWSTSDDTATIADLDYNAASGTVVFPAGTTLPQTLTVNVNGDIKWEANETFFVDLSGPVNADLGPAPQGQGTILNDDPLPQISIDDVQRIEGSTGLPETTDFIFTLSLSNPCSTGVSVDWTTVDGSATSGPIATDDFTAASGTVNFLPADLMKTVTVKVHGDLTPEPDEEFYVDLSLGGPLCGGVGGTVLKDRGIGTIFDDDAMIPGVVGFSAVAGGGPGPGSGTTLLQWFTPVGTTTPVRFVIEANQSAAADGLCAPPPAPGSGTFVLVPPPVVPGTTQSLAVGAPLTLNPDFEYCYSVWIEYPAATFSPAESVNARPFDASGRLKWKKFSGASLLSQPTVGFDAVVTPGNDMFVHAMARGPAGGTWPAPWRPRGLGAVSQQRAPIVPLLGRSRMFVSTQDGRVHSIDTADGSLIWSTQLVEGDARGAPAGIFTAFGGAFDYILVGTSGLGANRLYALDPFTGAVIDAFPQAGDGVVGIGAINSMPSVDYANKRVYFTSWKGGSGGTVWALDLGPSSDALSLAWRFDGPDNVNGSPVLHNGRVYLGDANDRVWSHDAVFGDLDQYTLPLGDGEPRGFLFPDRRNDRLYVATTNMVWAVRDTGASLVPFWSSPSLIAPSVVLHHPGTDDIYVGVRDYLGLGYGAIAKLNATDGSVVSHVPLENFVVTIGPPSLDLGFGMLHVGSEAGIIYAVQAGF